MYKISKEFHFSASHVLEGLPEGHQCARLHGHNYVVVLHLRSEEVNEVGFVQDYGDLKPFKDWIDSTLDHRHLNDIFLFNPTAENLAKYIFTAFRPVFHALYCVEVKETPKTSAKYCPG